MKKLKGKTTVELTIDEVNAINELIERNEEKAIVRDEKYDLEYCPVCNQSVFVHYKFCPHCGQRLDNKNFAL